MNKCTRFQGVSRAPSRAPAGISRRSGFPAQQHHLQPARPPPRCRRPRGHLRRRLFVLPPRGRAAGILQPCSSPAPCQPGLCLAPRSSSGRSQAHNSPQLTPAALHQPRCSPSYVSHVSGDLKLDTNFLHKRFGFVFTCRC